MATAAINTGEKPEDVENGKDLAIQTASVQSNEPFSIYAKRQKIGIIFTASVASFFSPMGANIYLPAINSVAKDLHVSNSLINLTLSTYLVSLPLAEPSSQPCAYDLRHRSSRDWPQPSSAVFRTLLGGDRLISSAW
jgi:hypothetical protein